MGMEVTILLTYLDAQGESEIQSWSSITSTTGEARCDQPGSVPFPRTAPAPVFMQITLPIRDNVFFNCSFLFF